MSIIDKILTNKETIEYFLVLGVDEHRITAVAAKTLNNEITIIGNGESEFSTDRNEIEAFDIAISTAENDVPKEILIEKVIFGIPVSFLDGEKIQSEKLIRLKKICDELSLKPAGFIEFPLALSYYLEKKEESSPTLILLSLGKTDLTFSLIRVGKLEKNIIQIKSDSVQSTFESILKNFKDEILPSRIVLFDQTGSNQMEEYEEELLRFPWHKHSSFLHTPKIEILPKNALITSLVETAAGSLVKQIILKEEEEKTESDAIDIQSDNFGFIKNKDISDMKIENPPSPRSEPIKKEVTAIPENEEKEINLKQNIFPILNRLKFEKLKPIYFLIGILIIIITLLFLFIYYIPTSSLNIIIYPKISTKQIAVTFTTDENRKNNDQILLASLNSVDISSTKTSETTGKTKVGEKAKGTVIIYNKTLSLKNFPKNTVLSSSNLKFALEQETTVASASDTGEGLAFGKTAANIIALEIGPESNLSSNNNFIFKDFPQTSYYAKNSEKFAGGSSREISSVSKDDQNQLISSLTEELDAKSKQEIAQKTEKEEKIVNSSIKKTILEKKFNKNVGDEAKDLSLSMTIKYTFLVYNQSDLLNLIRDNLTPPSSDYIFDDQKTQIKITDINEDKKGDYKGDAEIKAYFFPKIDNDLIKTEIWGKTYKEASEILKKKTYIGGIEIISENKLPFFYDRLPLNKSKIYIQVISK